MKQFHGLAAVARSFVRSPQASTGKAAVHPGCAPDQVVAALYALAEAHHDRALTGNDAADARARHSDRLHALRSAAAIGETQCAIDLESLVREALRAFQFGDATGISIAGPDVLLRPTTARLFALLLHELTSNAISFGALGGASTRQSLSIHWKKTKTHIDFTWKERGVAILQAADHPRSGFGKQLIETITTFYSGAEAQLHLRSGGVECGLTIPIQAISS